MSTSGEVFTRYLEILSNNDTVRGMLESTFIQTNQRYSTFNREEPVFMLAGIEFQVRWFWLYPGRQGISIIAQEDVDQSVIDSIRAAGGVQYILELRFSIPENLSRSTFWEKGVNRILMTYPSATYDQRSSELSYKVYPSSSSIPAIIRRSLEMVY